MKGKGLTRNSPTWLQRWGCFQRLGCCSHRQLDKGRKAASNLWYGLHTNTPHVFYSAAASTVNWWECSKRSTSQSSWSLHKQSLRPFWLPQGWLPAASLLQQGKYQYSPHAPGGNQWKDWSLTLKQCLGTIWWLHLLEDTNDSLQGVSNRIPEDKFITVYLIKSSA